MEDLIRHNVELMTGVWKDYFEGVALFSDVTFSSFSQLVFDLLLSSYNVRQLMH